MAITLSDASSFCIAADLWSDLSLGEGDSVEPERLLPLARQSEARALCGAAVDMLSRREHSTKQLLDKLLRRSSDADLCREVVTDLAQRGLVSDRRFAEAWVLSRIHSHPESQFNLNAGLRQRGIAEELARTVVDQVMEEEGIDELGMIRAVVRRASRSGRTTPARLVARLSRLGFTRSDVERVLGELAGGEDDAD